MNERVCLNCTKFEPDFYEETHGEMAGYCNKNPEKILLKYESQTCEAHRFKRNQRKD